MREAFDHYPTPRWCVRRLLEAIDLPTGLSWLEPAAGDGRLLDEVLAYVPARRATAVELVPNDDLAKLKSQLEDGEFTLDLILGDYLHRHGIDHHDVAITNPPYSLADGFARKMRQDASVSMILVRLGFLASQQRGWMSGDMPDVYVLPNRPSFVKGRTDSSEYAWLVWPGPTRRRGGTVQRLAETSVEERRLG